MWAQVSFTTLPLDKQLVARDVSTNKGHVIISGTYDRSGGGNPNYDDILVRVERDGSFYDSEIEPLNYTGNVANFFFDLLIDAELENYSIEIYGRVGASETLLDLPGDANDILEDIVAGDVYIIQGQSNAEANMIVGSVNDSINNYVRVYSSGTHKENDLFNNDAWYIGQGDGPKTTNGNTGQWGLVLANEIVERQNIPVAIFNGARGGRGIGYFQSDDTNNEGGKSPTTNNYERLKYRLDTTGLAHKVRAIFWAQGENTQDANNYYNEFLDIKSDWDQDYPNVEKYYIFQTDNNCVGDIENVMAIKEAQRQLAFDDDDIEIMTTAALEITPMSPNI